MSHRVPCTWLNKKNTPEQEARRTSLTRKLPNMDIDIRSRADGGETQRYNLIIELPRDLQRSTWEVPVVREDERH